jgi:hypothetical protein
MTGSSSAARDGGGWRGVEVRVRRGHSAKRCRRRRAEKECRVNELDVLGEEYLRALVGDKWPWAGRAVTK